MELKIAAATLVKALEATNKALENYFNTALEIGRVTGDPTATGLDAKQLRNRIKTEVVARLSPKPIHGLPKPVLQLDGAPEARRYVGANPLRGLQS